MTPRRIRNYVAPKPKPNGIISYSTALTTDEAARLRAALNGAGMTVTSFEFRRESKLTWRDRIRGWFA